MTTPGHIYFLRHGAFVKIGFSTNYVGRCAAISACTPEETEIVAVHTGTQGDEVEFHRRLSAHRHRLEWFRWCPEVEALAASGLGRASPTIIGSEGLKAARKAVGVKAIAEALNVTEQAITQWRRVPINRVLDVERVSGIPRHQLRPDFYAAISVPSQGECSTVAADPQPPTQAAAVDANSMGAA